MKHATIIAIIILNAFPAFSQEVRLESFVTDCSSDFWTITFAGYIQQWSLNNGTVSGGDTILSGGGTSLSYCGDSNAPTFFSNNYSPVGIRYYEPDSGWITIPTFDAVDNNGGHLNHQYYRVEGAVIQIVKYWDGTNLLTIDSLRGEFFVGVQDIAVDTFGQAWIFTGGTLGGVDSLKVYNQTGKINSYAMHFNHIAYGSFFLNDTLYIGTVQDSIYPIMVDDSTAELGDPIFFPSGSFTDMASCQKTGSNTPISAYQKAKLDIFPNPTSGYLNLTFEMDRSQISVYNSQGQKVEFESHGKTIDISQQASGVYLIKVSNRKWESIQKVMKL